jgi:hypothetical protein
VWPIFFMVWVAVWALIGQVRSPTFGSTTPTPSHLTTNNTINSCQHQRGRHAKEASTCDKQKKGGIDRPEALFGRFNKWWCTKSTHYPTTFLLDHLIILLETLTITNFDLHARPYRKKNDSTHNHVMGLPKNGYERFSSTRNKSSRKGMGLPSRAYQQMVVPRGPDLGILVQFIIKIQPEDHQYLFIWETQHFFMRRSLCPGQTVSPTPISGSANPSRPVARSSGTVSLDGVVQVL